MKKMTEKERAYWLVELVMNPPKPEELVSIALPEPLGRRLQEVLPRILAMVEKGVTLN